MNGECGGDMTEILGIERSKIEDMERTIERLKDNIIKLNILIAKGKDLKRKYESIRANKRA